uniref:Capsular polysaccharide synthesis protein n=1 Tax=viral metagenome TaxID=1070528 RepID=A0A6C0L8N2_9ZZZZ
MNKIYCFWTGSNELTPNRRNCLEQLRTASECQIVLVTKDTLNSYILQEHPLHEAYEYLSEVHKADYLRTYFMNFHGGGYSDIKYTTGSWVAAFDELGSSDAWMNGYKEEHSGCIAYPPVAEYWSELIGNGAYIAKPRTPLTEEWYSAMMSFLDSKLEKLRLNPSTCPRDHSGTGSSYPIAWAEMLGFIFHRVSFGYRDKLLKTVPTPIFHSYI